MSVSSVKPSRLQSAYASVTLYGPGLAIAATVAMASQFLSDHYGAPAMLMALLLGIAFNFLSEEGRCIAGIEFTAKKILRMGVALLGLRISVSLLISLGGSTILLLVFGVFVTMVFGLLAAKLLGQDWRMGILTSGAVGICGASAAMAIAAVLPKHKNSERDLIFTVLTVTVLSTMAMIFYPIAARWLGLDAHATGIFLGGTIHDVAQVVGAGFSVSPEVGEAATLVKLIRVTMLAPVVIILSLSLHSANGAASGTQKRPAILPGFVLVFLILAGINSAGLVPNAVAAVGLELSRWALLGGMVAVGMKTSLRRVLDVGGPAVALVAAETAFLAAFILVGEHWLANL